MKNSRILIVEDEVMVARDIQARLRQIGYRADMIAASGKEAVRLAVETLPDIILMDIRLSNGVDGVDAAVMINGACNIPIIYLTGFSDEASLARAQLTSPYGYVLKPVETTELRIAIEMAFQRHQLQTKLNESNRRLATTLASLGEGVVSTDAEGMVTTVNRVAAAMLGKHEDTLIGQKIGAAFDLAPGDRAGLSELLTDPVSRLLAAKKEKIFYSDTSIHNANGEERPVDVTASLIAGDRQSPEGAVLVFRDISLRKQSEEDLRHRAYHDQLTGLPNRSMFYERLHAAIAQSTRHNRSLALLFLDLDDFKKINDTLGHDAGDLLLKQLAERLTVAVRDDDIVARLAGDEFVIILNDIADISDVKEVVTKILSGLEVSFWLGEDEVRVTASIGVSLFPLHGTNIEQLMSFADKAMYRAKQMGKNAYAIYSAEWKNAFMNLA